MKRIYIAGPMAGIEDLNRKAFQDAAALICFNFDGRVDVVNPDGIGAVKEWTESTCVRTIASELLKHLFNCDAIYMLRGWERSKGARAEHAVAVWIGLEIIYQGGEV